MGQPSMAAWNVPSFQIPAGGDDCFDSPGRTVHLREHQRTTQCPPSTARHCWFPSAAHCHHYPRVRPLYGKPPIRPILAGDLDLTLKDLKGRGHPG